MIICASARARQTRSSSARDGPPSAPAFERPLAARRALHFSSPRFCAVPAARPVGRERGQDH